ncbi:MAG: hypothetical protein WBP81_14705 [Solirubrobacteraceae bacterium]
MSFVPRMQRVMNGAELWAITLGDPLMDAYLEFVGARGARNTWLATAYDLKVFFDVVGKEPAEVRSADLFAFLPSSAHRGMGTWCGSRTVRRVCRRGRSPDGCRASPGCLTI